ncbi:S1/P1 Nuclease [Lutibacter oricola]|uniref:S1/P1 Nuclease n=1 Tax=Lutibacter oricola TaxID=762486 RepID=A0A1H2ZA71_9FLAO|nr:S1/P1 nuclease [Lutibacter oricola]SDX13689.1 S1/P1 Nuclease [Lutibacter oricola]
MKKYIHVFIACFLVTLAVNATNKKPDWGQTGHRTIGEVASSHLKNSVKRKIKKILDGQTLVFVSTYADDIKSDRSYSKYYSWHYVNKPFDVKYEDAEKNPKGDLVTGIEECKSVLKDKNASKKDKAFHLKMLVHLIGDLHMPLHVGRKEDKGANDIQVQWFGNGSNLHRVWDSNMIKSYEMTYSEIAKNMNEFSKAQIKEVEKGNVVDWVNETGDLAKDIYGKVKKGDKLSYRYMYDNFSLVLSQLQKGGIRLAKVLNEVL